MVRKVKRLSKVIALKEHAYEALYLRKSVIIRTNRQLAPRDVAGESEFLTSEMVNSGPQGWTYLLTGAPSELDPVLARLETAEVVQDIVYSVLSL